MTHFRKLPIKTAVIAGGSAGNHTVTGIKFGARPRTGDQLIGVLHYPDTSTWITEADADMDVIGNYLHYVGERDGVVGGDFGVTAVAATTLQGSGRVFYRIGGRPYSANIDSTITLTDTTAVTGSNWKAWRIVIDRAGTVTTETDSSAGYSSEEDALLNLSAVAQAANTVEIGYWTVQATAGFTPQTDNTNAENAENTYLVGGARLDVGLTAALGSSVVADSGAATWSVGTVDAKIAAGSDAADSTMLGQLAQISAISNQSMDDADTIADGEAGGWVLVTNLAGTGVYALASDGNAGSVSALTDTDLAGARTAIDTIVDQLPLIFCPIGEIIVENASGGGFTAGTTNWDAAGVTTTVADYSFGTADRTNTSGRTSRLIDAPAVPASIAAAIPSAEAADLTSEFSITADDTINNAAGTDTTNGTLVVLYNDRDA